MKKSIKRRTHAAEYHSANATPDAINQLLSDIFASRGERFDKTVQYNLSAIESPSHLMGLETAVNLLLDALQNKSKILVVGDFDADGATSTAVALRCLQSFGHPYVDFLVPNRFVYGYGLTPEIVDVAAELKPDIIITVDNGISSIGGVNAAKALGIKVLITDHHLPGDHLPKADAIVNPNQPDCAFPSKNLAGVGVIFYLMSALRKRLRDIGWFIERGIQEPSMGNVLDLVALGTVADVVPLDYNNRILVSAGLKKMRCGQAVAGINALLQIAGKDPRNISAVDLGFIVGPRLNAAGRLDDMSLGIQCLLTDDPKQASELAQELDDLNRDRKLIEQSMQQEAEVLLAEAQANGLDDDRAGICLYKKDWHQGVIGILASRIKEKLHRPTFVFADSSEGEIKGSGRSIPGVHLRDVLDEVASSNPGLLEKFGGHAMAAGMAINSEKFSAFERAFDTVVSKYLSEEIKDPVLLTDGDLSEALISLPVAEAIRSAGPWGQKFPEPVFDGVFQIVSQRVVGGKHLKLLLSKDTYSQHVIDAIAFNVELDKWPDQTATDIHCVYQLDVNEFRGNTSVQMIIRYLEKLEGP